VKWLKGGQLREEEDVVKGRDVVEDSNSYDISTYFYVVTPADKAHM